MLQNISRELGYEEEINSTSAKEYLKVIKKIFTKQNVAVYILTFLISMVGLGDEVIIAPFGIALVASSISRGIPLVMVYLSSLIGTTIKFGLNGLLIYIVCSLLVLLSVMVTKPKKKIEDANERIKIGGRLAVSVFLVQFIYMIFTNFYFYDLLTSIMISISSYIFYKIFVNSISVINEYEIKKVFSIEEVIGASLLIAIAVSALGNFSVFSYSVKNIVCIFIVLYLGFRNGILVGATGGITIGVVLSLIGGGEAILIATYAISGMVAGLLNRFGKIGVVVGFILGNIASTYAASGGVENVILFQEILIAAIGLLFVPKKAKISIEDVIPDIKMLPEAGRNLEESQETISKLNSISKTITEMAKRYQDNESFDRNLEIFQDELLNSLEGLENSSLYDDIYNNEENIVEDILNNLLENGIMTEHGIISIFAKHNTYLMNSENISVRNKEKEEIQEIIKAINTAYRISKTSFIWQKKLEENNKNVSAQLKNVSEAINNITEGIKTNTEKYEKEKIQLKKILEEKGINAKEISIKQENTGRYVVNVYTGICDDTNGRKCPTKQIEKSISKILDNKVILQNQDCHY